MKVTRDSLREEVRVSIFQRGGGLRDSRTFRTVSLRRGRGGSSLSKRLEKTEVRDWEEDPGSTSTLRVVRMGPRVPVNKTFRSIVQNRGKRP